MNIYSLLKKYIYSTRTPPLANAAVQQANCISLLQFLGTQNLEELVSWILISDQNVLGHSGTRNPEGSSDFEMVSNPHKP